MSTINATQVEKEVANLAAFEDKLVPGAVKTAMKDSGAKSSDLWRVAPSAIKVRPGYNPRIRTPQLIAHIREVADSIKLNGFFDDKPLGVSIAVEGDQQVIYLEDGHTRHEAALIAISEGAPVETVPVVAMPRSFSEVDRLVHMVRSNNNTQPFNPLEMGVIVQRLAKFGLDEAEIAGKLGVTATRIRQLETLMGSGQAIRDLVKDGEISATLAIETVQEHGNEAEGLLKDAVTVSKQAGKKTTAKAVKKVVAAKKAPSRSKAALAEKSLKLQKKHGPVCFDLLARVMKKHGKAIDVNFHKEVDALFLQCGYVEEDGSPK